MLGIEPEKEELTSPGSSTVDIDPVKISVSTSVVQALAEAEAKRAEQAGAAQSSEEMQVSWLGEGGACVMAGGGGCVGAAAAAGAEWLAMRK